MSVRHVHASALLLTAVLVVVWSAQAWAQRSSPFMEDLVRNHPGALDALERLGNCWQEKDSDLSIVGCTALITQNPRDEHSYTHRGRAYASKGDYDRAINDYNKAIELGAKGWAHDLRGQAYANTGQYGRAVADHSKAIEISPESVLAYYHRAHAFIALGDFERARADFSSLIALPARTPYERQLQEGSKQALTRISAIPAPSPSATERLPKKAPGGTTSGTGVIVSKDGKILTNAHVVRDCRRLQVSTAGNGPATARVIVVDQTNDLALLKSDIEAPMLPRFRNGARVGESVFAYGFPLAGLLSSSGNFTSGIITANAGLNDDSAKLQFSAPVQPGNSGGALFDQFGSVVGIVVATVDAWAVANSTKSLPQNINFAIKASAAISFLEAHGVTADTLAIPRVLAPADIADRAREASVHVVCS